MDMEDCIQGLRDNSLTSWSVEGVLFSDFTQHHADRFLSALEQNKSLRELTLQGPVYEQHIFNVKENFERLFRAIAKLPVLKSLEIATECSLDVNFVASVMGLRGLEELILKSCIRIFSLETLRRFQAALQDHPSLRTIELRNLYMVGYAPSQDRAVPRLDYILDAFASIPNLEHAMLSCTAGTLYAYQGPLHSATCMAALVGKTTLKSFNAGHLRITDKDMEYIARSIGPQLESLRLSSYHPDDEAEDDSELQQLVDNVLTSTSHLKVFTIEGLPSTGTAETRRTWETMLISKIEKNYAIEEFKIPGLSSETRDVADMYLRLNQAGRRELRRSDLEPSILIDIMFNIRHCPDALFYILTSIPGALFR
jgi:hypothetical protein